MGRHYRGYQYMPASQNTAIEREKVFITQIFTLKFSMQVIALYRGFFLTRGSFILFTFTFHHDITEYY